MKTLKIKTKQARNKGFTLIELLVVIGIIALLSSIVLSSLTQAKAQANNTKQIADYRVVLNALLQFKQDNGYYPSNSDNKGYTCIGNYSDNGCTLTSSTIVNNPIMNDSLKKYLSSYNFLDKQVTVSMSSKYVTLVNDYKGFVLACTTPISDTKCSKGSLRFPALKNKNSCPQIMSDISASEFLSATDEYTWCSVDLN
ncbi:MAG: prepilin-type N-terminal cleavage/methylation domain-containing protein [bacterium]